MFFNNIGSSSKHQIYMTFQNMFVIFFRTTIYFFYFFPVSQMPLSVWVFLLEHSASLCELSYNPPDYSETFSSLAISEKDRNKLPYCIQFHMCILNSVSFLLWYNSDSTITQLTSAHFLFFFFPKMLSAPKQEITNLFMTWRFVLYMSSLWCAVLYT